MQSTSITKEQCRAGRAILGWSQDELAQASNVAKRTIADFEMGKRSTYDRTLKDMREAMEKAGVVFFGEGETAEGPGVALKA